MDTRMAGQAEAGMSPDLDQIIEIRDPDIDVEEVMARVRANVARRRAEGAYQEDLDAIAREVREEVMAFAAAEDRAGRRSLVLTLAELDARWQLKEQPFVSGLPILGRLIVAARSAWNWMSTKWYVRPLIQQQSEFNSHAVRTLREVIAEQQMLADRVERLEDLLRQQQPEFERLQTGSQGQDESGRGGSGGR